MQKTTSKIDTHRGKLVRILNEIYGDPRLAKALGFKGGTAAYLFYALPRGSVDLDFNLLIVEDEQYVYEAVAKILPKYGEVIDSTIKRFTIFFLLKYSIGAWKIKIEISRRPITARYHMLSYMGVQAQVMAKEDMAACKLAALLTRKLFVMRDVFDAWYFLDQHWEIHEEVFTVQTGWSLVEGLKRAIIMIDKVQKKELLQGVGELLTEKQKIRVREKLKDELLLLLRLQLELRK